MGGWLLTVFVWVLLPCLPPCRLKRWSTDARAAFAYLWVAARRRAAAPLMGPANEEEGTLSIADGTRFAQRRPRQQEVGTKHTWVGAPPAAAGTHVLAPVGEVAATPKGGLRSGHGCTACRHQPPPATDSRQVTSTPSVTSSPQCSKCLREQSARSLYFWTCQFFRADLAPQTSLTSSPDSSSQEALGNRTAPKALCYWLL